MRNLSNILLGLSIMALSACGTEAQNSEPVTAAVHTPAPAILDMSGWKEGQPSWFVPVEPFNIIGNLYSVGTRGLAVYLITDEAGHIVIDGGMPGEGGGVIANIKALGFDPADVKILLNTHAHLDHSGGLSEIKSVTGAKLLASEGDRSALEGGFYLGSETDTYLNAPPVVVDELVADGQIVSLGGIELTANLTPGHSRGCTSWTFKAGDKDILIFCSASVAANRLVDNPQYEGIVDDYKKSFAITKDWRPDVFLSNHPSFFAMAEKRKAQIAGDVDAFINAEEFPKFIARMEKKFEADYAEQKTDAANR